MIEKIKQLLKKIADCLNEHWIWKTIILFLPSVYLPFIVKYYGEALHLSNSKGNLTLRGVCITVILYLLILIINILSNYKSKRDKEKEQIVQKENKREIERYQEKIQNYVNTLNVHKRLLNVIGRVCDTKQESINNYIEMSLENKQFRKPFNETVCPEVQLRNIAIELKSCLSEITQPPLDNISVSMAYEFPETSKQIYWIDQKEVMQCMTLKTLRTNKDTTFYKIYRGESDFLFFNDKEIASKNGDYVFDQKDKRYHKIGSIICDEIALEDEKGKIARIILTISTYGYKFTDSMDKEVLSNMSQMIQEVILQQFEKRIRIELGFLFIKKQYNKQSTVTTSRHSIVHKS